MRKKGPSYNGDPGVARGTGRCSLGKSQGRLLATPASSGSYQRETSGSASTPLDQQFVPHQFRPRPLADMQGETRGCCRMFVRLRPGQTRGVSGTLFHNRGACTLGQEQHFFEPGNSGKYRDMVGNRCRERSPTRRSEAQGFFASQALAGNASRPSRAMIIMLSKPGGKKKTEALQYQKWSP